MRDGPQLEPKRRTPAKGVRITLCRPNWIFLTVCTAKRSPWLAQPFVQDALHQIWKIQATAWLVSDYVLMPDHLHLFCAPTDPALAIEKWMGYWKSCFTKTHLEDWAFQSGGFHHRLRNDENYAEKWQYAWENPVRKGLVKNPEDWPFWGRVHDIRW